MRNAYALLGLLFLLVFGGAYVLIFEKAEAPTMDNGELLDKTQHTMSLTLTSPMFSHNESIPAKFTCDGENINPPLQIAGIPEETKSLVLVMDDPDIPDEVKDKLNAETFDHWAVYNIPPDTREIPENADVGSPGVNSSGNLGYAGPCPPPQFAPTEHRYIFRLYALPEELQFDAPPTLAELEGAAKAQALASTELVGLYERAGE